MKRLYVLLMMVLILTTGATAQMKNHKAHIAVETRLHLQQVAKDNHRSDLLCSRAAKQKEVKLFVTCTSEASAQTVAAKIKALGAQPLVTKGRYVVMSTPVELVEKIADIDDVTYISEGSKIRQRLDVSRKVTGADNVLGGIEPLPQAFTGKGVVVGVIDGGFDYTHPAFKDAEGNLRIKSVYFPNYVPGENDDPVTDRNGAVLGGVAYNTPERILSIGTDEAGSHGTHCLASAGGTHCNSYGGMAPEADLVCCSLWATDGHDAPSTSLQQSIEYIRDYAARRDMPYIISMSLNGHEGPHDGTSEDAQMLEIMAQEGTNMVLASSNEADVNSYLNYQFEAIDTMHTICDYNTDVNAFTREPSEMSFQIGLLDNATKTEIWRSKALNNKEGAMGLELDFRDGMLISKNNENVPDDVLNDIIDKLQPLMRGMLTLNVDHLEDGRAKAFLKSDNLPNGAVFTIHITCPEGQILDMWGDLLTSFDAISDYYTCGDNSKSMGDMGTGGSIITVGAWVTKDSFTDYNGVTSTSLDNPVGCYAYFSSYGTDIAGHDHPFISAPGVIVISALSSYDNPIDPVNGLYVATYDENGYCWGPMSGTSMSTPAVAGIIALWLEAKPTMTYQEIKDVMAQSAITDEWTEQAPIRYGHGKIDAYKGLLHILGLTTSVPTLSQHQPKGVSFRLRDGFLYMDGAEEGIQVRIYTTDGRLVQTSVVNNGCVLLPDKAGIYAVQVGSLGSTLVRI